MENTSRQDESQDNQKRNSIRPYNLFNFNHPGRSQRPHHFGFPDDRYPPFSPTNCNECIHSYSPKHTDCLVCWKNTEGIIDPIPVEDC